MTIPPPPPLAASDVFARAPPQQQQQQQQQPESYHGPPPDGIHMELAQRTSRPHLQPPPAMPTQRQQQVTSSTIATIVQQPEQIAPTDPTVTTATTNIVSSVSVPTTSSAPSPSFAMMTDMNKSLDALADEFLIGPGSGSSIHSNTSTSMVVVSDVTNEEMTKPTTTQVILAPDPLPAHISDYERLHILVKQRAYMDALLYTRMLLEGSSSHYTSLFAAIKNVYSTNGNRNNSSSSIGNHTNAIDMALDTHKENLVVIMSIHITAMMKLNLLQELIIELDTWTFCFHHRQTNESSTTVTTNTTRDDVLSWIPWKFHILAASALQYRTTTRTTINTNKNSRSRNTAQDDCLDALHTIRNAISDSNERNQLPAATTSSSLLLHVENAVTNVYIAMKNYRMALQSIQRMIHLIPSIVQEEIRQLRSYPSNQNKNGGEFLIKGDDDEVILTNVMLATYESDFLSRQGRLLLQLGALDGADAIFDQIKMRMKDLPSHDNSAHSTTTTFGNDSSAQSMSSVLVRIIKAQVSSNDGLLKFSNGKYEEALESFNTVIRELRSIKSNAHEKQLQSSFVLELMRSSLYCETINNMALCALYTCRLHEGIQVLESLIRENVTANLNERIALNICTMYELAMDTSAALRKKKILQCIANRFLIQDIPVECFRIS